MECFFCQCPRWSPKLKPYTHITKVKCENPISKHPKKRVKNQFLIPSWPPTTSLKKRWRRKKEIGGGFPKGDILNCKFYLPSSMWIGGVLLSHLKPMGKEFNGTNSLENSRSASLHSRSHVLTRLYTTCKIQNARVCGWLASHLDSKARKVARLGMACILTACQSKRYVSVSHRPCVYWVLVGLVWWCLGYWSWGQ